MLCALITLSDSSICGLWLLEYASKACMLGSAVMAIEEEASSILEMVSSGEIVPPLSRPLLEICDSQNVIFASFVCI
jgi:hypothetical protein